MSFTGLMEGEYMRRALVPTSRVKLYGRNAEWSYG